MTSFITPSLIQLPLLSYKLGKYPVMNTPHRKFSTELYKSKQILHSFNSLILAKFLLVLLAAVSIGIVFYVMFSRINYSYELEWMEGGSLLEVVRILSGQSLYVQPSLSFIPYIYTPVYFYFSAFLALFTGPSFLPLRLISVLSTFGSMILIYKFVHRETNHFFSSLIAVGLFAATYKLVGFWFDIARVDSLFLFFLLWTAYLLYQPTQKRSIFAGILLAFTLLTKQTGLIAVIPLFIYLLLKDRKNFLIFTAVSFCSVAGVILIWNVISSGWFLYYVWFLPHNHTIILNGSIIKKLLSIFFPVPITLVFIAFFLDKVLQQALQIQKKNQIPIMYYGLLSISFVGVSWAGRLNPGGFDNVLLPAYAAISILFGLGVDDIFSKLQNGKQIVLPFVIVILIFFQFYDLRFPVSSQIPNAVDNFIGNTLIKKIKDTNGEVLIPSSGYLALEAGKKTYFNMEALEEINSFYGKGDPKEYSILLFEINQALEQKEFSMIILDNYETFPPVHLTDYYTYSHNVTDNPDAFMPKTGWNNRPQNIYLPKP